MASKESRDRLAANLAWYRYVAKNSSRVYCQKNIRTALEHHVRCQTGDRRPAGRISSEVSSIRPKRGEIIHSIAQMLASFDPGATQSEHFLRVDVKGVKPKQDARSASLEIAEVPFRMRTKMTSVRCKCELTIWNLPQSENPQFARFVPLLRDSQQCTITPFDTNGGVSADIHLDEAFFVNARKLLVPVRGDDRIKYLLGQTYRIQISLQPMIYNQIRWQEAWPPVPVQSSEEIPMDDTERILHLDAKMDGFPVTPMQGSLCELKYAIYYGRPKLETKYALEVEALWSKPQLTSTTARPSISSHHNLPAVPTTMRVHSTNAHVLYVFPLADPFMVEESPKTYKVLGYVCPFCHNQDLQTSKLLQFHLVTDHDLFDFSFSESDGKDQIAEPVHLLVEVSDASSEGGYDEFIETDSWIWIKPRNRPFNLQEYLKGDDGWITGKRRKGFRDNKLSCENPPATVAQIQRKDSPRDLPKRVKKRFRVPQAAPGGAFFRTLTKRVLRGDELLSESDEDVDESWLKKKHARVIDSFIDLTETEKSFIKRWDDYMFEEKILANRYVGDALIRFTRANRIWLQDPGMLKEFFRHATKLLLYNGLSHSVVQKCIHLIRGTDEREKMEKCADTGRVSLEESNNGFGSRKSDGIDEDMSASSDAMELDEYGGEH